MKIKEKIKRRLDFYKDLITDRNEIKNLYYSFDDSTKKEFRLILKFTLMRTLKPFFLFKKEDKSYERNRSEFIKKLKYDWSLLSYGDAILTGQYELTGEDILPNRGCTPAGSPERFRDYFIKLEGSREFYSKLLKEAEITLKNAEDKLPELREFFDPHI